VRCKHLWVIDRANTFFCCLHPLPLSLHSFSDDYSPRRPHDDDDYQHPACGRIIPLTRHNNALSAVATASLVRLPAHSALSLSGRHYLPALPGMQTLGAFYSLLCPNLLIHALSTLTLLSTNTTPHPTDCNRNILTYTRRHSVYK